MKLIKVIENGTDFPECPFRTHYCKCGVHHEFPEIIPDEILDANGNRTGFITVR